MMKNRFLHPVCLKRAVLPVLFLCGAYACIDDTYDLDKDISMEMNIGGKYFAMPIGSTDTIHLDSILKVEDSDIFGFAENGVAMISQRDTVDVEVPEIAPVVIEKLDLEIDPIGVTVDKELPAGRRIGTVADITVSLEEVESSIDIRTDAPKELAEVEAVRFRENPMVRFELVFEEVPVGVDRLRFSDYRITFPDFIVFARSAGEQWEGNTLVLNEDFSPVQGFRKNLEIIGFRFESNPIEEVGENKQFAVTGMVTLGGKMTLPAGEFSDTDIEGMRIQPAIVLDEMDLGVVEGRVEVEVEPVDETVELEDLPDFLKDDGVVLDIDNPAIKLEVANTLKVPMGATLRLVPYLGGNPVAEQTVEAEIEIGAAKVSGVPHATRLWLSKSADNAVPAGYTHVEVDNLPALIRRIPDSIKIEMQPQTIGEEHEVDLAVERYGMDVNYDITVPLSFGKDFRIIYRDTTDGLQEDLEDFIEYVTYMELKTEVESTIPLGMMCEAVAIDVDGNVLEGVGISTPQPIRPAGWEGDRATPVTSKFDIILREEQGHKGQLGKLDGLVFKFSAEADKEASSAPTLRKDQYIRLRATLRVPGGVTVDADEL